MTRRAACATTTTATCTPIDEMQSGAQGARDDPAVAEWLDDEIANGNGTDPAMILYTSGTTGPPRA